MLTNCCQNKAVEYDKMAKQKKNNKDPKKQTKPKPQAYHQFGSPLPASVPEGKDDDNGDAEYDEDQDDGRRSYYRISVR